MEHFKNNAERFYREVRNIEIYPASAVKYIDNFRGIFPDPSQALYAFDVVPETYSQKIATKKLNGDYYTDIDINFPLLDLSVETREKCQEYFNKKNFAIIMNGNMERMLLGNDREQLKVEFIDNLKNDNSGSDECTIAISGETTIAPKIQKL